MLILALLSCLTSSTSPALASTKDLPRSTRPKAQPSGRPSSVPSRRPSGKPHQKPGLHIKTVGETQKVKLEGKENIQSSPIEFKLQAETERLIQVTMVQNDAGWELNTQKGLTLSFSTEGATEIEPMLVTESGWKAEGISLKLKPAPGAEKAKSVTVHGSAGYWICRKGKPKDCARKRMRLQLTTGAS